MLNAGFFLMIFAHLELGITGFNAVYIISIILNVVMIVCTILLLVTAFKNEKPKRLLPWLIIEVLWLIFTICAFVLLGILMLYFAGAYSGATPGETTGHYKAATGVAIFFFCSAFIYGGRSFQLYFL